MELQDTVNGVLGRKGGEIWSVPPDATVYEAVEIMAREEIGALLVIAAGTLLGIVSERDYARKIILKGRSSRETRVEDIMTSPPIAVTPRQTVTECMRIMTERRLRHLPVVEDGRVLGIVSIGDLVNWIIGKQEETIHQLHHYIAGGYPG